MKVKYIGAYDDQIKYANPDNKHPNDYDQLKIGKKYKLVEFEYTTDRGILYWLEDFDWPFNSVCFKPNTPYTDKMLKRRAMERSPSWW